MTALKLCDVGVFGVSHTCIRSWRLPVCGLLCCCSPQELLQARQWLSKPPALTGHGLAVLPEVSKGVLTAHVAKGKAQALRNHSCCDWPSTAQGLVSDTVQGFGGWSPCIQGLVGLQGYQSGCMAYRWLLNLFSNRMAQEEHHRNLPLCSLLDSDGTANAETSVDTGAVDPTETAAYAGEQRAAQSTQLPQASHFKLTRATGSLHAQPLVRLLQGWSLHLFGRCLALSVPYAQYSSNPHNCSAAATTAPATTPAAAEHRPVAHNHSLSWFSACLYCCRGALEAPAGRGRCPGQGFAAAGREGACATPAQLHAVCTTSHDACTWYCWQNCGTVGPVGLSRGVERGSG